MQEGVSPESSHLAAIIQQSKVSLSCSVKFSDLNFSKSSHKVPPNICSDPVAYCKSDFVVFITEFLFEEKKKKPKFVSAFLKTFLCETVALMLVLCCHKPVECCRDNA